MEHSVAYLALFLLAVLLTVRVFFGTALRRRVLENPLPEQAAPRPVRAPPEPHSR